MSRTVTPNFLIVGAARSGTTSLYHWLGQHPDVFMPLNKEPSFFVHTYGFSNWGAYLALFEPAADKKAVGEASTPYMSAPESPAWIRRVLGDVKIIILLRNPVERAWSLYSWMIMEGYEWLPSFEHALAEEERRFADPTFERSNPQYFWNYMYFRSGLYHRHVSEYLRLFGAERVRVYPFEDLVASPATVYSDVCAFLGIASRYRPRFLAHNASVRPRSVTAQYALRRAWRHCVRLRRRCRWRQRAITWAMTLNRRAGAAHRLQTSTRRTLEVRYRESVSELGQMLDRDYSAWLS